MELDYFIFYILYFIFLCLIGGGGIGKGRRRSICLVFHFKNRPYSNKNTKKLHKHQVHNKPIKKLLSNTPQSMEI